MKDWLRVERDRVRLMVEIMDGTLKQDKEKEDNSQQPVPSESHHDTGISVQIGG